MGHPAFVSGLAKMTRHGSSCAVHLASFSASYEAAPFVEGFVRPVNRAKLLCERSLFTFRGFGFGQRLLLSDAVTGFFSLLACLLNFLFDHPYRFHAGF
jgi:hypothetical protein